MNLVQIFEYEGMQVRVLGSQDAPLFVAADVCRAMGLGEPGDLLRRLDDDEKTIGPVPTIGGEQQLLLVTEPGLYRFVMESRSRTAYAFQRWAVELMRQRSSGGVPFWQTALEKLAEFKNESAEPNGRVYFVRGAAGHIKIGYSSNVFKRIEALQCSSPAPLELLATMPGDIALERAMHKRFEAARVSGEWFRPTDDLLAFVRSLGGSSEAQ